jgi:hypothetical protein
MHREFQATCSSIMLACGIACTPVQTPATAAGTPTPESNTVRQIGVVQIEATGCHAEGTDLTCRFLLSTLAPEATLQWWIIALQESEVALFDESGNSYDPYAMYIGNVRTQSYLAATVLRGVSTPASIIYRRVPPSATRVALLRTLMAATGTTDSRRVSFREIPITRD